MRYAEIAPPPALRDWVKALWTLDCDGEAEGTVQHTATPDGCIEVIRRLRGRSDWRGEQPETFVAGVITRPALLRFSGDARFIAVRLWPWAWNAVAALPAERFVDEWRPLASAAPFLSAPDEAEAWPDWVEAFADRPPDRLGGAILRSADLDQLAREIGLGRRTLQRRFACEIGVAPRAYLRLLRFQDALRTVQGGDASLADEAAAHGFSDQAHMAREFRALAGTTTGTARRRARGPFV